MDEGFAEMRVGFARVYRFSELQQLQFVEWRAELRGEMVELRDLRHGSLGGVRRPAS